jgi:hypothetical protein
MYGPGRTFRTNSLGFRNEQEFGIEVPKGKIRIICSGDSFTLGYGVANQDTWCEQLTLLDNRVETVNMGQGGYGADQAYLWYMRDGTRLQHDIHIFAFITDGFLRMKDDNFLGYGKPVFHLKNNSLIASNVPVPRKSYFVPRLTESFYKIKNFRSFELMQRIYAWIRPAQRLSSRPSDDDHVRTVAKKLFQNLGQLHEINKRLFALVYLPAQSDHFESTSNAWRGWLKDLAVENGIIFIDLVEPFRRLPWSKAVKMFRGHYSEEGNQFVASALYRELLLLSDKLKYPPAVNQR